MQTYPRSGEYIVDEGNRKKLLVIGHNPPTNKFDETNPRSGKKISYLCKVLECGKFEVLNLYSEICKQSQDLPVENTIPQVHIDNICSAIDKSEIIIAAWGSPNNGCKRASKIIDLCKKKNRVLHLLERNSDGSPTHFTRSKKELYKKESILNSSL